MRKSNKNKVILMGGNLLGCMCLKELLRTRNVEVITVICNYEDNGSIIEPKTWNASLLRLAMTKKLPILQTKNLTDEKFLKALFKLEKPDYIITVQYENILTSELLNYPIQGCINIHYSILPYGRGYFPISWALIENKPIGVTIHWLDEGIDTGDIIARQKVEANGDDTAISLYHKATSLALKLFKTHFPLVLEEKSTRIPQPKNEEAFHSDSYPHDRNIDWSWEADKIERMVRALTLPPHPFARTYYEDFEIEILDPVEIIDIEKNGHEPGQIIDINPSGITVQTEHGCVRFSKIRLNQSLFMNATKFSQNYQLTIGDFFKTC